MYSHAKLIHTQNLFTRKTCDQIMLRQSDTQSPDDLKKEIPTTIKEE